MKALIIGYKESGKTTAARILADILDTSYANTSDIIITEFANDCGLDEEYVHTHKDTFRDELWSYGRVRQEKDPLWPQSIIEHVDILTGVRNLDELDAARNAKLYDIVIWIDRPGFGASSTDKLSSSDADVILKNDGSFVDLRLKLRQLVKR